MREGEFLRPRSAHMACADRFNREKEMSLKQALSKIAAALVVSLGAGAAQADVLFWSTQAKPVE